MGKETNLVKVIRLNVKDLYENNFSASLDMDNQKEVNKSSIMVRESELIRIVQHLSLADNDDKSADAIEKKENKKSKKARTTIPFIKDIIILKVGKNTTKFEELVKVDNTKDYGIITFNNIRYKYLMCSSSSVRSQKAVFINESLFDKANEILLCGISADAEHKVFAKFNSYYGLASTDSIPVTMPKIVVIEDYKTSITENFDIVKRVKVYNKRGKNYHYEYSVDNDVKKAFEILPFDGAGLVSVQMMVKWKTDLKLDYIPSAVQFRCIAGLKGNLYAFDLKNFAKQYPKAKIKGIDNILYDIKAIDAILTRSQFKFADMYGKNEFGGVNIQAWKTAFETELHGYQRTFNISEYSEPVKELKNVALTAYQPMQTLQFSDDEIEKLCKPTIEKVKKISTDIDEFLMFRGLEDDDTDKRKNGNKTPPYYEALLKNRSLCNDTYIKDSIKDDLREIKRRCCCSKIMVNGNYQVFSPDIFGLAQWAFGQEVTGLLNAYEVYSNYWNSRYKSYTAADIYDKEGNKLTDSDKWYRRSISKIDVIRSPHIANEHQVVNVVQNEEMCKWYKYQETGIVTSIKDSLAMKLNSADYDGDHILTVSNDIIISAAERNRANTILFEDEQCEKESKIGIPINDIKQLIKTNVVGMKNNIGNVVNKISVLWSLPQTEEIQDYIKIMSIIGSLTIDFVKTGEKATIPSDILKLVGQYKKPEWMKYLKKKELSQDKKVVSNAELIGASSDKLKKARKYEYRECNVQKICDYMQKEIGNISVDFVAADKFDFTKLIKDKVNCYNETYKKIAAKLIELQEEYGIISNEIYKNEDDENNKDENNMIYKLFFNHCQYELLSICSNVNKVLDYMIAGYYTEKELITTKNKAILWNSFPKDIINRTNNIEWTKENETDNDALIKKAEKLKVRREKAKVKITNSKSTARLVKIKFLDDIKNKIIINKNEIKQIKELIPDSNSQRVFCVLLGLSRKCGKEFYICKGKKEQITETQICKMADIESRAFKTSIKKLIELELITICGTGKEQKNLDVLCCYVNFENATSGDEYETINEYAKNIPELFPKTSKK